LPTSTPVSLTSLVTQDNLRRLAGETFFERGESYFSNGSIRSISFDGEVVAATVEGSETYRVKLWAEAGRLMHSCSCPVGDEGYFCKHCVAAGLAWLAGTGGDQASGKSVGSTITAADIRTYLATLPVSALVELILEQARDDEGFYRRLMLKAAKAKNGGPDLAAWRQAFDEALESAGGFDPYSETAADAEEIGKIVDELDEMLEEGHLGAVAELAAYALEGLAQAQKDIDDSEGELAIALEHLGDLHLDACLRAAPDPEELASLLFEWETKGIISQGAVSYAEVLGESGLAQFRRLAAAVWEKLPALAPGESDSEPYGARHRITGIMESLAQLSGDTEALVAVRRRDLSVAYNFLRIAEIYKANGQSDQALDWAERGWLAFAPERQDPRLREFLADAYHARGRRQDALELIWQAFVDRPGFASYQSLKSHADRFDAWTAWRDKALAFVREQIEVAHRQGRSGSGWMSRPADRSTLVEIFLWEGTPDLAWHEAKEGGCSRALWLRLAETREESHPEEAVALYREYVSQVLTQASQRAYEEATKYLGKLRALLPDAEFTPYLTELRRLQWRRRNFIKILDQNRW
jgi:uncharacterized Zn finger protein